MYLAARHEVNTGKGTIDRGIQRWNMNLCQMHVHLVPAVDPGYRPPVYNR